METLVILFCSATSRNISTIKKRRRTSPRPSSKLRTELPIQEGWKLRLHLKVVGVCVHSYPAASLLGLCCFVAHCYFCAFVVVSSEINNHSKRVSPPAGVSHQRSCCRSAWRLRIQASNPLISCVFASPSPTLHLITACVRVQQELFIIASPQQQNSFHYRCIADRLHFSPRITSSFSYL